MKGFGIWFEKTLKTKRGKPFKPSSRATALSQVAAVFVHAYEDMEITEVKPIPKGFRGKVTLSKQRKALNEDEFVDIKRLTGLNPTMLRAQLCLIIQAQTGMDYCDLKTLQEENLEYDNATGMGLIKKGRQKNGQQFAVPITQSVIENIRVLHQIAPGEGAYMFKLPSTEYTIRLYHKLGAAAGVSLRFSTKAMRHTFAAALVNNGTPLDEVQPMLGHADPRQTAVYGRVSDDTLRQRLMLASQTSKIFQ